MIKIDEIHHLVNKNTGVLISYYMNQFSRVCRGRDRMVVGFITTYAISACHHWCWEL